MRRALPAAGWIDCGFAASGEGGLFWGCCERDLQRPGVAWGRGGGVWGVCEVCEVRVLLMTRAGFLPLMRRHDRDVTFLPPPSCILVPAISQFVFPAETPSFLYLPPAVMVLQQVRYARGLVQ